MSLLAVLMTVAIITAACTGAPIPSTNPPADTPDVLVYTLRDDQNTSSLIAYHPETGESVSIAAPVESPQLKISPDGRIALSAKRDGMAQIDLLSVDPGAGPPEPINQDPAMHNMPLAWSLDGRYLFFESYSSETRFLYVWDGSRTIDITPYDMPDMVSVSSAVWSRDGRLAYEAQLASEFLYPGDAREIFLWDGQQTVNVSQNPGGEDSGPAWGIDGQLAFLSDRGDEYDVLVWDGVSLKDGSPDADTFTNVAPELTDYYSFPEWSYDGQLVFLAIGPDDTHSQIYEWDGGTATNISQNADLHNGSPVWSPDGRWAFATYFSPEQVVYVRDTSNKTVLTVEGQYGPAWSSDGYLALCARKPLGIWALSIWDGDTIVEIALGEEISVQWRSGQSIVCSNG
jgi:WD40 repeat protein